MGGDRSGYFRRTGSLSAVWLFQYRVSADDPEIRDSGARWHSLRGKNYPERILLSGLSLYLEQRGRTHHRATLASFLSRPRGGADLSSAKLLRTTLRTPSDLTERRLRLT